MDSQDAKKHGTGGLSPPSACLEIRLFYVRVSPCSCDAAPPRLTLSHLRREMGVSLEINGCRIPASEPASIPLRRDRGNRGASEVTYVSTDSVRLTGPADIEVLDNRGNLVLCGSLERMEPLFQSGTPGPDKDQKTGWSMNCCSAAGSSTFVQPKLSVSAPSIEVYIAGCCSGHPLILTQTVVISPRRKPLKPSMLDAIPEDEEALKSDHHTTQESLVQQRRNLFSFSEDDGDEYDPDMKEEPSYYPDSWYSEPDDDGQLSWFNAGVRVGVGIGLGMCVGIGIGVGLLMRSYQATTRSLRRHFI